LNCHICQQDSHSFIHNKTQVQYYHCFHCEYIFKSEEYYRDFRVQKKRYDLHQNNDDDLGYQAYFQKFLNFTLEGIGKVKNVLDFGCGRSTVLARLIEDKAMTCDYYDPIYHPKVIDKKYDLIVCVEVFEHLHEPSKVFEYLLSLLHEGGYLAIQTEFHSNDKEKFEKWYYPNDPTHIVFFRPKTFEYLAQIHGCKYIKDNAKNILIVEKLKV
jgi:cyclopropane fatty-acyl-phospholipid synthase-like methyltransferase